MRILLVDDSLQHRRAGMIQLEALGHEVLACSGYGDARKAAEAERFDAALIDLLMPAEATTLGTEARIEHVGREIAIGFPLAIELARLGLPKIAVATDTNHHNHPMSAVVDWFEGKALTINGAVVRISHAVLVNDGAKDWAKALADLLQ